jgi:hypothetical protein
MAYSENSPFAKQIENKNFLSPIGFRFSLTRAPKVDFFSNRANIPDLTLGTAVQPTPYRDMDIPGDKIIFGDFNLSFIIDEDFENYLEIHNWIRSLGYPRDLGEYARLLSRRRETLNTNAELPNIFSDGSLFILNSTYNISMEIRFENMFPYTLQPLEFDATMSDVEYFTSEVSFKYTMFELYDPNGNRLS